MPSKKDESWTLVFDSKFLLALLLVLSTGCGGASKRVDRPAPPAPLAAEAYAHYLRGQVAFFEGDFALAVPELRHALRAAPDEAPIAVALVSALYESGDRASATREMQAAQQRWPESAQVWMKSAALARGSDDHVQAAANYKRAIKRGAHTQTVYLDYAAELYALGKRKQAEAHYRKVIAEWPISEEAHYQLARMLHESGNTRAAAQHLEQVIDLAPYHLGAWALLSVTLRKLGEPERAVQALRHPFDRSGGDGRVAEQLFMELLDLGPQANVQALVPALDRDDLSIDTRIGMGHLQLRMGDFQAALATSERLRDTPATGAPMAELRARALRGLHRNDEARAELLAIPVDAPGYPLIRAMLAELLADLGKFDEAEAIVLDAIAAFPDDAELTLAHSTVLERAGRLSEARQILQEAIARHPGARRPLYALAELEARRGQHKRAIEIVTPLVAADPRDASALNYVGYTLIEKADSLGRARALLQRALELSPDSAFILDSYGWLLLRSGALDRARPYLERAARLSPAEPDVILHLAELRWLTGERKDALALFRRAESLALSPSLQAKIRERKQILQVRP